MPAPDPDRLAAAIRDYADGQATARDLAARLGIGHSTFLNRLRDAGVPVRRPGRPKAPPSPAEPPPARRPGRPRSLPPEAAAAARAQRAQGQSLAAIARGLGTTISAVRTATADIPAPARGLDQTARDHAVWDYLHDSTSTEIAERLGVSHQTVLAVVRAAGLPTRRRGPRRRPRPDPPPCDRPSMTQTSPAEYEIADGPERFAYLARSLSPDELAAALADHRHELSQARRTEQLEQTIVQALQAETDRRAGTGP